jgi:two-component system response regulator AtoC
VGLYNFLIVDLNPHSCPANTCGHLAGLVRDSIPAAEIDIQLSTLLPLRTKPSQPDLIFLRPSSLKVLPDVLHKLRKESDRCPIIGIFCTGWDRPGDVSEAVVKGLDDFLTCPYKKVDLFPRIRRLLDRSQKPITATRAGEIKSQFRLEALVGESKHFVQAIGKIPLLAMSDTTVLITGETGTGKELVARAVHYRSARHGKPFIPVNCGALPDNLFENELFGHIKGAFTDASSEERGLVIC